MDQLVNDSSRPSKFDAVTMNISTELAIAQFSQDPLQKIRHISEAFIFLQAEDQKIIVPEESDRKILERIRRTNNALSNMIEVKPNQFGDRQMLIPWQFSREEGIDVFFMFYLNPIVSDSWGQDIKKEFNDGFARRDQEILVRYFQWLHTASMNGIGARWALNIKTQFSDFAMPIMTDLSRKILKQFIDGTTWETTLLLMRGGKGSSNSSSNLGD